MKISKSFLRSTSSVISLVFVLSVFAQGCSSVSTHTPLLQTSPTNRRLATISVYAPDMDKTQGGLSLDAVECQDTVAKVIDETGLALKVLSPATTRVNIGQSYLVTRLEIKRSHLEERPSTWKKAIYLTGSILSLGVVAALFSAWEVENYHAELKGCITLINTEDNTTVLKKYVSVEMPLTSTMYTSENEIRKKASSHLINNFAVKSIKAVKEALDEDPGLNARAYLISSKYPPPFEWGDKSETKGTAIKANPTAIGSKYAVVVGISQYKTRIDDGGYDTLSYADNDANDFAGLLKKLNWNPNNIKLLTNTNASKRNIESALLTWLRRAGANDLITLFWSGHGFPDPGDSDHAYLACYDSIANDPSTALRMDKVREALEERKARNVVVFADTCHSGKIIKGEQKRGSITPDLNTIRKNQIIPKGWIFITSSDKDRSSYEDAAWQNGALTEFILRGLSGEADGFEGVDKKDNLVTMLELKNYIEYHMKIEGIDRLGVSLVPQFYKKSSDDSIWGLALGGL